MVNGICNHQPNGNPDFRGLDMGHMIPGHWECSILDSLHTLSTPCPSESNSPDLLNKLRLFSLFWCSFYVIPSASKGPKVCYSMFTRNWTREKRRGKEY